MLRWLVDLVGVFIGTALLQWVVRKLPRALVDNAMTGYIDNKIGAVFGITEGSVDAFLSEWIIPLLLAVAAVWLWHRWAARQLEKTPRLEENKGEFSEIMEAIWWIAERSAWGHWQDAQMAGRAEVHKLHSAEHMLRTSAQNAEITISGRISGTSTYLPIDQHFWRLVFFDIQPDPRSLWRAEVKPRDGVQTAIPNYDSLIVKRSDVESLPWVGGIRLRFATLKLFVLSKFKKSLRRTMSWFQPSHIIVLGLLIALCGVVWQSYRAPVASPVVATHIQLGPEPSKPAAAMKRMTAYDIEQRIRAVDTLLEYLDPKIMQISAQGEKINASIFNRIEKGTAVADLDNFADSLSAALTEYFALAARFQRFSDNLYEIAVSQDWPVTDIPKRASLLRAELQDMKQRGQLNVPPSQVSDLFRNNKLMHDLREATTGKFWTWINDKKNALIAKRREYENTEIYEVKNGG